MDPHEPGHGSLHFWFMQARLLEHSALIVHSGRQFGGTPIKLLRHEHEGDPLISLHWLLGPQGDGSHGFIKTACGVGAKITV